ncbi:MAG: hypothetical protein S4CHLAM2_03970 [Chlamydiales bacterium]|nr:hypothetical protein [Chlamydiales bacterium]
MKKIAIVRRNGLGDLLCAFPLVRFFQMYEPETKITLFVDRRNSSLIPYLPAVDQVVVLPARGNKLLNTWRVACRFRHQFQCAYSAKTSPMKLMNFFLYLLKAEERFAYVDDSWHSRLVNRPLHFDSGRMLHQAVKSLRLVDPNCKEVPEELYPVLTVPKNSCSLPSPTVLVSATTTRPASRLDTDRYAALLNRLHACKPISVLIVGQPKDASRAQALATQLNMHHLVHFPRNFEEFMVFLDAADYYFVEDGGVAHIGAALGKRGVILYGETNPIEWAPLSKKVTTFYHPVHVNHLEDEKIFEALKRMRD